MCGITGFFNPGQDFTRRQGQWENILETMTASLVKRGPDNQGLFISPNAALGHQRLSIRDLERGTQPMVRRFGEYRCGICYNGEIYNTAELKKELQNKGYLFETTCDTEVILLGMTEYGTDFISRLNGIFAFAFWNERTEQLIIARDHAGVKPLFYTVHEDTLIFASEIKALFLFPGVDAKITEEGLCEVFGIGPARTAGNGVFKNVKDVLPGHFLICTKDGIRDIEYWDLKSQEHTDNYEDTVDRVRTYLFDAVEKQMVSDVPVCCFLSGGVDSSIVTALSAQYLKRTTGERLHTFSFDFTGNDQYFKSNSFQPDQDRPWVEKMVRHCDTDHTFLVCSNEILADYLYQAVDAKDLPGMADVESSLLYFCEEVKKTHKVTLTGECADEIFGGYPWFHREDMFRANAFPWSNNIKSRKLLLSDRMLNKLPLEEYVKNRYQESIAKVPVLDSDSPEEKRRRELAYLNIKWFMATLLDRMDRTSMYSGLEARVPFADHRIMEYVFNVPWSIKYKDHTVKHLLRKSAEGLLPHELLYRKKSPYPKTYNPEYENILAGRVLDLMADPNQPVHDLLDKKKVTEFINTPSDYGKPWFGQLMAGPQMLAYVIQINYWLKKYNISIEL